MCFDWRDTDSSILIVHTSAFAFAQTCATNASSAALAVPFAGLRTATLQKDGTGFAAVLKGCPEGQPATRRS